MTTTIFASDDELPDVECVACGAEPVFAPQEVEDTGGDLELEEEDEDSLVETLSALPQGWSFVKTGRAVANPERARLELIRGRIYERSTALPPGIPEEEAEAARAFVQEAAEDLLEAIPLTEPRFIVLEITEWLCPDCTGGGDGRRGLLQERVGFPIWMTDEEAEAAEEGEGSEGGS